MTEEKIDMFMMANNEKLPDDKKIFIREQLAKLDDSNWVVISSCSLRNPTSMLIISILVGCYGVDRFMLGQTGLGILKLVTCGGATIWAIIDWFRITNMTKEYNYNKLLQYL